MVRIDEVLAPDGPCLHLQAGDVLAERRGLMSGVVVNRTPGELATLVLWINLFKYKLKLIKKASITQGQ
jgi:hypothetical protein